MKNKKILILANLDVGLYKFRKALIKKLIDQGNEVYIYLPKGMLVQNLKEMGCHFIETPVDRRGINPATDLKLMMRYFNILGKIKPDLVITYTIKPNIYGGIAARFKRIPYAVNITGLGTAFQNENMIKKLVVFFSFVLFLPKRFAFCTQDFRIRMSNLCTLKIPCSYLICPHIHDAVNYDCNCQQRKLTHNIG